MEKGPHQQEGCSGDGQVGASQRIAAWWEHEQLPGTSPCQLIMVASWVAGVAAAGVVCTKQM